MKQLNDFIQQKWISSLQNCIVNSLRDVSKGAWSFQRQRKLILIALAGWLNLQEKNREVYQFSKLKKFMTTVNLMMQAALRFLIQDSARKYSRFLFNAAKYSVTVNGTNDVQVVSC